MRVREDIVLSFGTLKGNEKIFEIVELPKKDEKNRYFSLNACICQKKAVILRCKIAKNNKTDEYGSSIKTAGSAGNYL